MNRDDLINSLNYEYENDKKKRDRYADYANRNLAYKKAANSDYFYAKPNYSIKQLLPEKYRELYQNNAEAMNLVNALYRQGMNDLVSPVTEYYVPFDTGFWTDDLAKNYLSKRGYLQDLYNKLDSINTIRNNKTIPFYKNMIENMFIR